jgi:hypothetical protein
VRAYWIILQLILACSIAAPAAAETYRNAKLGFSFQVPAGGIRCSPDPATGPEHGASIWLDGRGGECGGEVSRPVIVAVGNYNAMFWESPAVANQNLCTGGDLVKPPRLELRGHASAACQVMLSNGWVAIKLNVMAGKWPGPHTTPEGNYPYMLYTMSLYTTKDRLKQDIDRLRAAIRSFRIFPPQ